MDKNDNKSLDTAIFAGGCFWCMVQPFDSLPGVEKVVSGYTGGHVANPSYEQVCSGLTGHVEAVEITYDPEVMPYKKLLQYYWQVTDPTDAMGQFQDRGNTYQPIIFYNSQAQKEEAEKSKQELQDSGKFDQKIVTQINPAKTFYPAEDYHQDFYKKDPLRYQIEESGGRAKFIKKHWQK
ncbi:peptide-methionine (S)-S-oxide reductase MsrA [Lactobacillus acetotolerans]|uniref:Peptide methionine sulfoxide reductase MsrA n=1 Tax=Lactobacillus acetotolerans TaxID=1600 RepID=A0A0D6A3H3_9LACO|nr:peptide-methionine (S)-S-oxide reductase MsrA [Lactobacillus acetotolerans]KRN40965.1 peptide methionine sulfoxide reductase [Lactobacillus acetotolerans DSM 20749 = JCM 3825]QFG51258.1 peptide-methionine (S)-S-oxide reductase MsrA [Lactobacillus acetotolerans]QJD73555.1 peptide-methionine (S)-S-oxide reductase MsrA [Lactobacillus acetotolerans]BAQ57224.1 peptide methionine sulfoxide reductase [Lactobacillus acetotolerans]GGV14017.1 peptide methionine sulfoxide reductase MsrA [Lactobacillus